MKEMKSETTKLTKEFKLEQEQLKQNGTETDKLKSKVEYLKSAHELTKQSVKETEEQLKKAKETYGENSKEVKTLEDKLLNAQIAEQKMANSVQDSIKALETEQKAVKETGDKFQEASDKIGKFGDKAKDVGGTMSKGVTAPIVAVGAAALLAFNEVDEGIDTIITKTGASGEAMEGFEDSFNKVFGSMPSSAADVGIAIGEVNTRFGVTDEKLEALSKTFLQFAEINGTDLNNAIGTTNKIMKQWNIESEHAGELLGLLTSEGQATGISVDTLMNSVQQNGAALKSMGFSLTDSVFLLSDMESAGVNGDVALTALKKATVNYAKAGKDASQGLKDTVKGIKSAATETDAMTIATEAFGGKAAPEMMKAIREGRFELNEYEAGLGDFATTVEDTFEATLDPPDQLKVAMNNVKLGLSDLATVIFEVAGPSIEKIGKWAKEASERFKGLTDGQKKTIVIIGGILAAIGPLLVIVGTLAGSIVNIMNVGSKVAPVFKKLGGIFKALGGVLGGLSLPVVLITAGIILLVGAIIYLWNTNEDFRNAVIAAWEKIKETGKNVWEWLVKFFTEDIPQAWQDMIDWFGSVGDWFADLWKGIKESFTKGWKAIEDFFTQSIPNWWKGVKQKFADGWKAIVDFFTETIPQFIKDVGVWLLEFPNKFAYAFGYALAIVIKWGIDTWNSVKETVKNIFNSVIEWFSQLPTRIEEVFTTAYFTIVEWGTNTLNNIKETCVAVFESITEWFSKLPSIIWEWLVSAYNNISTWGRDTYNTMNQAANDAINAVVNWFSTLPGIIWEWLSTTISNVKAFASNLASEAWNAGSNMVTNLIDTVSSLPSKMLDIGKNIVTGLWEGITGMMGWLGNRIKSFTNNVVQGFKDGMQIKSPSRKMMVLGEYTTEGFAVGMEDKIKAVKETIKDIVGVTTDGFSLANSNNLAFSGASASNMSNYANTSNSNQFIINATVRENGDIDKLTDTILYKMENKRRGSAMGKGEY